jgi:hypothetical protein
MRKMRLKKDKPRAFFHHEKIPGNEVERRVPPQKPENLSLASSLKSHAFDFIRFSRLCLSPLLARLFQNRDDYDDVYCDDDVFVDDDFSLLLFREEAFTIGANEKKKN